MKAAAADKLIKISSVLKEVYGDGLHQKRQLSLSLAAIAEFYGLIKSGGVSL